MKLRVYSFFLSLCFLAVSHAYAQMGATEDTDASERARPSVVLTLADVNPNGRAAFERQLERAKEAGFGCVLVRLPPANGDAAFWPAWSGIAKRARQLNLKLAFFDFALPDESPTNAPPSFARHINRLLSETQRRLSDLYGTTLLWYQFPAPAATNALPPAEWNEHSASVIRDLVQEAGLDAGIRVDLSPLAPEETPCYFRRPMFPSATNPAERLRNERAAGGSRIMDRKRIYGWLPPPFSQPAADALFADGATHLILDAPDGLPSDDALFRQLRQICDYIRACQFVFEQTDPAEPDALLFGSEPSPALAGYRLDAVNLPMLKNASLRQGSLTFPSARAYSNLVALADAPLLDRLAAKGVHVFRPSAANAAPLPVPPDLRIATDPAGQSVRWQHRASETNDTYFLVADTNVSCVAAITFRDPFKGKPLRRAPLDGNAVPVETSGDRAIRLPLAPSQSCFLLLPR